MKTLMYLLIMVVSMSILVSCSGRNNTINEQPSSLQSSNASSTPDGVRDIKIPSELIGTPDRIYIVKGKQEMIFKSGTDDYIKILSLVSDRFPETMKEAAMAILWVDASGSFDWDMMSNEFDFLRLAYDTAQTVKMNCMNENYKDLPVKEISFNDMVFPLTLDHNKVCMIGTQNTYGALDDSPEVLADLLGYVE